MTSSKHVKQANTPNHTDETIVELMSTFEQHSEALSAHKQELSSEQQLILPIEEPAIVDNISDFVFNSLIASLPNLEDIFSDEQYYSPQKQMATQQKNITRVASNKPRHNELPLLYRLRDGAFFKYMKATKTPNDTIPVDVTPTNIQMTSTIISTLQMTKNHLHLDNIYENQLSDIEQEITSTLNTQRTWTLFFLELLPNYFKHETLQQRIKTKITSLSEDYITVSSKQSKSREQFKNTYSQAFRNSAPGDIKQYLDELQQKQNDIERLIECSDNEELKKSFQIYQSDMTLETIGQFMEVVGYTRFENNVNKKVDVLAQIADTVSLLHPTLHKEIVHHQTIGMQEPILYNTLKEAISNSDQGAGRKHLNGVMARYQLFLKHKTPEHFKTFYDYVNLPVSFDSSSFLMKLRPKMELLYPEYLANVSKDIIPRLNKKACSDLLKRFKGMNITNPVAESLLAFICHPTWSNLEQLQTAMTTSDGLVYHKDPVLESLMSSFMAIFTSKTSVNALEKPTKTTLDDTPKAMETVQPIGGMKHKAVFDYVKTLEQEHYKIFYATLNYTPLTHASSKAGHTAILVSSLERIMAYQASSALLQEELDIHMSDIEELASTSKKDTQSKYFINYTLSVLAHIGFGLSTIFKLLLGLNKHYQSYTLKTVAEKRNQVRNDLYNLKTQFEKNWEADFQTAPPSELQQTASELSNDLKQLHNLIENTQDAELANHYQIFLAAQTKSNLLMLCNYLSQYQYKHKGVETPISIVKILADLYPDAREDIKHEQDKVRHTLALHDQVSHLVDVINPLLEGADQLHLALKTFQSEPSDYHCMVLYKKLKDYNHPLLSIERDQLMLSIETVYVETMVNISKQQQERMAFVATRNLFDVLVLALSLKSSHAVRKAVIKFVQSPTWEQFYDLEQVLINNPDYEQEPTLSELVMKVLALPGIRPIQIRKPVKTESQMDNGFFKPAPVLDSNTQGNINSLKTKVRQLNSHAIGSNHLAGAPSLRLG